MSRRRAAPACVLAGLVALLAGLAPGSGATAGSWDVAPLTLDGTLTAESLAMEGGAPRLATVTPRETVGFASCDSECLDPDRWTVLTDGLGDDVTSVSVTMAQGVPVVAFAEAGGRVAVAACARACDKAGSWTTSDVDTASAGTTVSLGSGPDGTLHLAYTKNGQLRYGRCCKDGAWSTAELAANGAGRPALVVSGDLPRIAYVDGVEAGDRLRYLACSASPCGGADWTGAAVGPATAALGRPSLATSGDGARVVVDASDGASPRALQWFECQKSCADGKSWSGPSTLTDGTEALAPSLALTGAAKARLAFVACQDCGTVLESRDVVVGTCDTACDQRPSWTFSAVAAATGSPGVSVRAVPGGMRLGWATSGGEGAAHFACDSGCTGASSSPTTTTTAPGGGGDGGGGGGKDGAKVLDSSAADDGQRLRAPSFNDGLDLGGGRRPRAAIAVDDQVAGGAGDADRGGPVPVGPGTGSSDGGVPPLLGVLGALMLSGVAFLIPRAARAQIAGGPLVAKVVD